MLFMLFIYQVVYMNADMIIIQICIALSASAGPARQACSPAQRPARHRRPAASPHCWPLPCRRTARGRGFQDRQNPGSRHPLGRPEARLVAGKAAPLGPPAGIPRLRPAAPDWVGWLAGRARQHPHSAACDTSALGWTRLGWARYRGRPDARRRRWGTRPGRCLRA